MFSCTLPPCSPIRKQSKIARERERKKSLQKGKDRYNIVKGLAEGVDGISFESLLKRRHYLRAKNNYLILEPFDDSEDYSKCSKHEFVCGCLPCKNCIFITARFSNFNFSKSQSQFSRLRLLTLARSTKKYFLFVSKFLTNGQQLLKSKYLLLR